MGLLGLQDSVVQVGLVELVGLQELRDSVVQVGLRGPVELVGLQEQVGLQGLVVSREPVVLRERVGIRAFRDDKIEIDWVQAIQSPVECGPGMIVFSSKDDVCDPRIEYLRRNDNVT